MKYLFNFVKSIRDWFRDWDAYEDIIKELLSNIYMKPDDIKNITIHNIRNWGFKINSDGNIYGLSNIFRIHKLEYYDRSKYDRDTYVIELLFYSLNSNIYKWYKIMCVISKEVKEWIEKKDIGRKDYIHNNPKARLIICLIARNKKRILSIESNIKQDKSDDSLTILINDEKYKMLCIVDETWLMSEFEEWRLYVKNYKDNSINKFDTKFIYFNSDEKNNPIIPFFNSREEAKKIFPEIDPEIFTQADWIVFN